MMLYILYCSCYIHQPLAFTEKVHLQAGCCNCPRETTPSGRGRCHTEVGVETEAKASDTKGPEAKKRKVRGVGPWRRVGAVLGARVR